MLELRHSKTPKHFLQSATHFARKKSSKSAGLVPYQTTETLWVSTSLKKPPLIVEMATNGNLNFANVNKVTFEGVGGASNAVIDTTTGKIGVGVDSPDANLHVVGNCFVSTNFELGGTMTMGTVTVRAQHELSAITATGNTTPHTVEFQNATTGLVTTGNVSVGKDFTVTGNVAVDTDTLFVDSVNNRVGVGTTSPGGKLNVKSGVFLAENQASTNSLVLYYDGGGSGGNNNQYNHANAKFGTGIFVNDTGTTGSTITLMNKEGANNTTKHASIGFVNTDSTFNGKFGGQIGFWPEDNNATKQQFRIYTSGASAGYNLPVQQMVVTGDGNVGIGTTSPTNSLHVYKDGAEATSGLFIEKASGDIGTAASLLFGTNAVGENEGIAKAGIFFQRTATNGRGDFQFCLDNVDNATPIGLSNSKMTIKSDGNVGIGNTTPTQILDVGSSLSNPFICRHLSGSLHDADKRDSVSFGRIDGNDFLGMKCRVDTHTNLGYGDGANQTKIGFFTWGNNFANSREVMSILGNGCLKYQKQPRFSAYSTSGNATYSGTSGGPVVLDSTFYNVGSHYSTSTGAFTAPVAGHYRFSMTVFNNSTSSVQVSMWYRTSNSGTWDDIVPYILLGGSASGDETIFTSSTSEGNSWTIDLYVPANYQIGFGGRGGAPLTIYRAHSYFSGELISIA